MARALVFVRFESIGLGKSIVKSACSEFMQKKEKMS